MKGQVVFFRAEKGYGYLRLPDTREEFYFRAKPELAPHLLAGAWVSFKLRQSRRNCEAISVEPILLA